MGYTAAVFLLLLAVRAARCTLIHPVITVSETTPVQGTFVWQGLDHGWNRSVVGFETPHRIGSFANFLESQQLDIPSCSGKAVANETFTPGVNGDFSHPKLFSTLAVDASGMLQSIAASASFHFTDQATLTDCPSANTSVAANVSFDISAIKLNVSSSDVQFAALLSGIRMDEWCDPAKQPSGHSCNSNGMWPSRLWFELESCKAAGAKLSCTLLVDIFRSWSAKEGGGKPFNFAMDFTVFVYVNILAGSRNALNVLVGAPIQEANEIHDLAVSGTTSVGGVGGGAYSHATVGIQGFGFQMHRWKSYCNLGRYMQRLVYSVRPDTYDARAGSLEVAYTVGYEAPLTTVNSDISYYLKPVLVQLGASTRTSNQETTSGVVCRTGPTFSCKSKGLANDNNDPVHFVTHCT